MSSAPSSELQTRLPIARRLLQRLPLHGITVLGGLCSAWILGHALPSDRPSIGSADLLRYVPILIGLGANVGVQSSTILVRAFATGEIEPGRLPRVVGAELAVGAWTGLICGAATAAVAFASEGRDAAARTLATSVGLALCIGLCWAALVGCLVPIACRRLRVDPAIAAGPFLIMLSDVGCAALFMWVATSVKSGLA